MWAEEPETPEEWMMRKEALSLSRKVFDAMSERDAGVTLRVANGDTYEAVGAVDGISRERTRQLAELGGRKLHAVHCRHGSWVDTRECLVEPCAVSELELEPLPNALCTRCKAPFTAAHSARRWCDACRLMRCEGCGRSKCKCPAPAECEDCGKTRMVSNGNAGKRCRACFMSRLNGPDASRPARRKRYTSPRENGECMDPLTYSIEQAATAIGVSVQTLRRRIKDGTIGAKKLGGRVLILRSEIERILRDAA